MALINGNTGGGMPPRQNNMDLVSDDETNDQTMNGETPSGAPGGGEGDEGEPTVLCTVMDNRDGTYNLIIGDEPDDDESLAAPEGGSPAEDGVPAMPKGRSYDGPGPLLKAILDLVRKVEDDNGSADAQESFNAGFNGDKAPTPRY